MNIRRKALIIGLLALLILGTSSIVFAQSALDPGKTNVSFTGPNGATLRGYLATPGGSGPFPGVVMV